MQSIHPHSRVLPPKTAVFRQTRRSALAAQCCSGLGGPLQLRTTVSPPKPVPELVLWKKAKLHDGAVTSGVILGETAGTREFATSSLDKTVLHCSMVQDTSGTLTYTTRLSAGKGPLFALAAEYNKQQGNAGCSNLWIGTSSKEVVSWLPPQTTISEASLDGHSGWVRSLAVCGRWLFSCGGTELKQWDLAWPVPRLVSSVKLYTGDIVGITCNNNRVFTCGVDGSVRSWDVDRKGSGLIEGPAVTDAHSDRISGIACNDDLVFTVGFDGALRAWDANTLTPVAQAEAAHDGERVHCVTVDSRGIVYTGGDDNLVKRWDAATLAETQPALYCHQHAVRMLAVGNESSLLSGDSAGFVALWNL